MRWVPCNRDRGYGSSRHSSRRRLFRVLGTRDFTDEVKELDEDEWEVLFTPRGKEGLGHSTNRRGHMMN